MFGIFSKKISNEAREAISNQLFHIGNFSMNMLLDKSASGTNKLLNVKFDNDVNLGRLIAAFDDFPRFFKDLDKASPSIKAEAVKLAYDMNMNPSTFNESDGPFWGVALVFANCMANIELYINIKESYKGEKKLWGQLDATGNILIGAFKSVTNNNEMHSVREIFPLFFSKYS